MPGTDVPVRLRRFPDTAEPDRGFTLVELLIVIVILGILAVVTVFAVRGITDKGQENAEGTDLDTLETAVDAYWLEHDSNPTEAQLVSGGFLKEASDLHDLTVAGDGSATITNVRTGQVVGTLGANASGGATATTAPAAVVPNPPVSGSPNDPRTNITYAGFPAQQYGSGSRTVLMIGYDYDTQFNFGHYVNTEAPFFDTRIVYMYGPKTNAELDAILAANPTYIIGGSYFQNRLDAVVGANNYARVGSVLNFRTWYFANVY